MGPKTIATRPGPMETVRLLLNIEEAASFSHPVEENYIRDPNTPGLGRGERRKGFIYNNITRVGVLRKLSRRTENDRLGAGYK